jgi:uncharacterized membrane protein
MQVTITLNHLVLILFCGFLLGIVLYAVQIYKKIRKELSITAAKFFRYQGRLFQIEQQMESIAVNVQYMREEAAGKNTGSLQAPGSRHGMKFSGCLAKLTKALIC